MDKKQIDQLVRDSAGLDIPINIGDAIMRAEHIHVTGTKKFIDLCEYMNADNVTFDLTEPLVVYFKDMPDPDLANVIIIVDGQDLDMQWLKKRGLFNGARPPSFVMFACNASVNTWHPGAFAIGNGLHPVTFANGTVLSIQWLDGVSRPPTNATQQYHLQQSLGVPRLFFLRLFEQLGVAIRVKHKSHTDITILAHDTHPTRH